MKRLRLLASTLFLLAACTASGAQDEPDRYFEPQGEFSFVPPEGWTAQDMAGLKYQVVLGQATGGFAPNINVVDEAFLGSLAEYVDANIATMQRVFQPLTIVSREEFIPNEGAVAARLSVETTQQRVDLRQTFYFFSGDGRYFVVTCTRLAEAQVEVDALCDQSMKTFRLEP